MDSVKAGMEGAKSSLENAMESLKHPPGTRLKDKVAVVTGAASGIGREISLLYASEGAIVVVADLVETSRASSQKDITTHGLIAKRYGEDKSAFVKTNVTKPDEVNSLVDQVVQKFGRLDIMVNGAGIAAEAGLDLPVWEITDEVWEKGIAVNLTGLFYCVRAASKQMIKQTPHPGGDRGWIINLASIYGLVATLCTASYISTKHGVMGLTKQAALDCAPHRVHVNAICPGYINTEFTAAIFKDPNALAMVNSLHPFRNSMGTPQDVAGIALFLASDDAKWVTGTGIVVDGGYTAQ